MAKRRKFGFFRDVLKLALLIGVLVAGVVGLDYFAREEISGQFTVIDGDSLRLGERELRLRGIDAPEFNQQCQSAQGKPYACGLRARDFMKTLVAKTKELRCVGAYPDKYGRILVECDGDADGRTINQVMVLNGWAVAYGDFERDEADAERNKRGIWAGEFQRPSSYRADHRTRKSDTYWSMTYVLSAIARFVGIFGHAE